MVTVNEIKILGKSEKELLKISRDYLLALNLEEMKKIQGYFAKKGRNPTDVELETIAQTWSEHCVHKTFKGIINTPDGEINGLLKTFIMKATEELNMPWCKVVFKDNAGIVEFDDNFDIAMKVETHNHPTALDPYGGAGTGSGGVFRDVMGVGAKPILSTDVLFFGPLDYPFEKLPRGAMHPKRLMKGSVAGIRDYGNKMGIPTANGGIGFDEGYVGNPLVYAGCVGIIPKNKYIKNPRPGDAILLVGGRTGRDGIHGVTFASLELTAESEKTSSGAVQIGNPIVEKKVLDGLLRARDAHEKPLYSAVTDCGGGGLSSAAGEMGKDIGIEVNLEKVPLKYAGLEPWEIWISEAQERMLLAVPQKNVEEILKIFENENCEATVIGRFTGDKKLVLRYKGRVVADLDMDFVHEGIPRVVRKAKWRRPKYPEPDFPDKDDLTEDLKAILKSPNVASKEWVIRQYDHEVQAKTVIKPLQGIKCDGPGDACVLKPVADSWKGIVVSNGINPKYSIDPYNMVLSAIDEAIRNNVCCGGRRIAILDNFSWGNPEREDNLGQLVEACKACYDGAIAFKTPFISGKDSLYNEYDTGKGEKVSIPPTLLISAIGIIPDVRKAVTMDVKEVGNPIYIIGETKDELGGSHYYFIHGFKGNRVPTVDLKKAKKSFDALIKAMDKDLVRACHDCSEGGIGVAATEMAFAGELGMRIYLEKVPTSGLERNDKILFSESNSRFLVEIKRGKEKEFEKIMKGNVFAKIGEVTGDKKLVVVGLNGKIVEENVLELKKVWKSTFDW
ncbi:MAG: phosphoribosylformylglycinamidine synthase subunit PurL [Candidatus Aenigmarchaeota archaeon]|nr:phosphoribosylformylglycinamidine synthase subunit PurL [Candidatus Aenigmarchaeota archaeon]